MESTISSKGQVTVPVEIRRRLGLRAGTRIEFELRPEGAFLRRKLSGAHPVDRVYGVLTLERPVDEIVDEMRGERPSAGERRRR